MAAVAETITDAPTRANLGWQLAKASARWNERLYEGFVARGFPEVRPAYGSVLLPLFEEDGLRMGELARRARLSKQTVTTLVRLMERSDLVAREPDPDDGRATRVRLTGRAREFAPVAAEVADGLERKLAERLGARRHDALRGGLSAAMDL
ncbi:MAG TPA: MarR family transcriptional regulator [Solirubrobacteraceae bacterium]|nr:MarR family transcriptional regulator [Solirubrobacteraceae bacterium]